MFQIESGITIDRPIEEVFAFVADNENDPQWCVPVVDTTRIVGDAPGANTRYSFGADGGFFTARGEFDIVDFQPPGRIAWEGYSPFSYYQGTYTLKAEDDGTCITIHVDFRNKLLFRPLESRMHKQFAQNYEEQFRRLKALLEGSGGEESAG